MYASISGVSMDPKLAKENAVKTAADAEIYGENQAEVYASIGTEKWWLERNFDAARLAFLLSIKLDDQFSDSHKKYSSCLAALGRHKEAKEQIQLAMSMEPESPIIQLTSAQNYFFATEYVTAIRQLREIILSNPRMSGAYRFLAMALEQQNHDQEALDELNTGKFESEDPDFLGTRGHIFAHMKRFDEALKDALSLEKLKKENKSYISPYDIALIYAAMPDRHEEALKWLRTAIDEFDPRVTWLKVDPRFTELQKSKKSEFTQRLLAAGLLP
jgi:tetratricopeptide (TPR) repeat protein